ncbi:MAG: hypothetical protein WD512_13330, partial [Candidatus Paceibacterota bacterium]
MLKDYRFYANSLKQYFLSTENWPELYIDSETKKMLQKLDSIKEVNDYSIYTKTGAKNHTIMPSQYILYAVQIKTFATVLKKYFDFFEIVKKNIPPKKISSATNSAEIEVSKVNLDDFSKSQVLKPFIEEDYRLKAKSIVDKSGFRGNADVFGSTILQVINVPNASSGILGDFIYDLTENMSVFNYLEKKYINRLQTIIMDNRINRFVYLVLMFLDNWDQLERIFAITKKNSDEDYLSISLKDKKLTSIFRISDSVLTQEELKRGGKERFFSSPITLDSE